MGESGVCTTLGRSRAPPSRSYHGVSRPCRQANGCLPWVSRVRGDSASSRFRLHQCRDVNLTPVSVISAGDDDGVF